MSLSARTLQLVGPLGTGDLATVYRATDPENGDRPLAVAILHDDLSDLQGVIDEMVSRSKAVADLLHPGLVVQEGLFEVSGRPGLVQELVPGVDLIRLAKVGQVPPSIASAILQEAGRTLLALKADGWAHGYLSPRRTLLTLSGRVKISGVGARAGTALVGSAMSAADRGRVRYASSERGGGLIDHPGDVYALGAMLSLLLTGTWPRRPESDPGRQQEVAQDSARRIREDVQGNTDALAEIVASCMAAKSGQRPTLSRFVETLEGTAADAVELEAWAAEVVPGLGGSVLDGLADFESEEPLSAAETRIEAPAASEVDSGAESLSSVAPTEVASDEADAESLSSVAPTEVAADEAQVDALSSLTPTDLSPDELEPESPVSAASAGGSPEEKEQGSPTAEPLVLGTLGPPPDTGAKEPLAMPPIDVEDLSPIEPDEETDLVSDIDTDESERNSESGPEIDPEADRWDRMLGLDVVPDSSDVTASSDQVPQRSNMGFLLFIGVLIGLGVVWSLGLLDQGEDSAVEATIEATPQAAPIPEPPAVPAAAAQPLPPEPVQPEVIEEEPAPVEEPRAAQEPEEEARPEEVAEKPPVVTPISPPVNEPPAPAADAPDAAPAASPPAPQTGSVRVAGDAHQVRFVLGGRRYSGGRMPPGSYHVEVVFRDGESPRVSGRISIEAGARKLVRCDATFYRCNVY